MTVDAAHVRSAHAHNGMLDRCTRNVLGGLDRFLNRRNRLVEFHDDALARAPRFRHAVPAIAQAAVSQLRHQSAGLGAAYINRGKKTSLLVRHAL